MDFGSCSSHLLPNFTHFRNLLTPDAVRDTLCSGPDYTVVSGTGAAPQQQKLQGTQRMHTEHDFSETQPLTKLPAAEGPLNTSSCAAAPFRHVFPDQPETSSRTPPGLPVYSAEGPMPAMYKTITRLSTEITHCHKQSYCNSTFCRSPLFILRRWMRTSHNSHRGDKCLGMKTPV